MAQKESVVSQRTVSPLLCCYDGKFNLFCRINFYFESRRLVSFASSSISPMQLQSNFQLRVMRHKIWSGILCNTRRCTHTCTYWSTGHSPNATRLLIQRRATAAADWRGMWVYLRQKRNCVYTQKETQSLDKKCPKYRLRTWQQKVTTRRVL